MRILPILPLLPASLALCGGDARAPARRGFGAAAKPAAAGEVAGLASVAWGTTRAEILAA